MDDLLKYYYAPLEKLLSRPNLVELSVIGDGRFFCEYAETGYGDEEYDSNFKTAYWSRLCKALANSKGLIFDPPDSCFLSLALPKRHRFQATMGQRVESGIDVSVRLFRDVDIPLEAFGLYGDLKDEIVARIKEGANCILSGGTSTGKTTFLRQLIKFVPSKRRIITVEDTREIFIKTHPQCVHHLVPRNGASEQQRKDYADVIDHIVRSRPDVLVLGEISTSNSFPIVRLLNTGHGGFFTTVHANGADLALSTAIPQNISMNGQDDSKIEDVLRKTVDIVIQISKHITKGSTKRYVSEVLFPKEKRLVKVSEIQPTLQAA